MIAECVGDILPGYLKNEVKQRKEGFVFEKNTR